MDPNVVIVATLDTKGDEAGYLRQLIEEQGCSTTIIDVGTLHPPAVRADISREEVTRRGGTTPEAILELKDRRVAVQTMIDGAGDIVSDLCDKGELAAIISLGGGTGTHIGTGVMRRLPLGVPKLMLSTVASRDMSRLIGTKDIAIMHSVTDILGLNAITRRILGNAAAAVSGMARNAGKISSNKPIIGLTSFGFITEGAMRVKAMLEALGYDVAPFHANGTGGMAMEDLVDQGLLSGVIDFALHEFADQLYGGYCGDIGPGRLESAGRRGIPQVVVPGGLDCIVLEFDSEETRPAQVKDRKVFWYDFRSGVRTSVDDCKALARTIAQKLGQSTGPSKVVIPLQGWSEADGAGAPLHEPEANQAFVSEIKHLLDHKVQVIEVDAHINDERFARAAVLELHAMMETARLKT